MITKERAYNNFLKDLNKFGKLLRRLLQKELRDQGHKVTGALLKSIDLEVNDTLAEVELQMTHLFYGKFLDQGTRPKFRLSKRGRRKGKSKRTSKYIQALIDWIRTVGFAGSNLKNIKSTAFAIAVKQQKYGNPIPFRFLSKRAKRISKNGRRLKWIEHTLGKSPEEKFLFEIQKICEDYICNLLEAILNQVVKDSKKQLEFL